MRIIRELIDIRHEAPHPVLTIGNFDGVHLGHQAIFRQVIRRAQNANGTSAVLTFYPHPLKLFRSSPPPLITSFEEKMALIEESGVELVLCLDFTPDFARLDRKDFVDQVLWGKIGLSDLFVGRDFAFGRHRQGDIPYLRQRGAELGFEVHTVDQVKIGEATVSSSLIRHLVREGAVERAAQMLGRPFALGGEISDRGTSEAGNGQQLLEFRFHQTLAPSPGFYAVKVSSEIPVASGAGLIGICQVLSEPESPLRLHLSEPLFRQDAGKALRLNFLRRLCRAEEHPPSLVEVQIGLQE